MVKKLVLAGLLSLSLLPVATNAQVVVRIGPPAAVVEHPGPPPGPGFVWIAGFHRWDGGRYVWVPGHYERPPHRGARWVPARWQHRHGGWVMTEGHWR